METMQLYFEELDGKLHISRTCEHCKRKCRIYCISDNAEIYCNKYKNATKCN